MPTKVKPGTVPGMRQAPRNVSCSSKMTLKKRPDGSGWGHRCWTNVLRKQKGKQRRHRSPFSSDLLLQEAHHSPKAFKDVKIRDKSHEIRADGLAGSFLSEMQGWSELALERRHYV